MSPDSRRSFFRSVAISAVAGAIAGGVVYLRRPDMDGFAAVGSVVVLVAICVLFGNGAVIASRTFLSEQELIERANRGQPVLRGGERLAVIGAVEATGPPLKAPFSGRECAAYAYEISARRKFGDPFRIVGKGVRGAIAIRCANGPVALGPFQMVVTLEVIPAEMAITNARSSADAAKVPQAGSLLPTKASWVDSLLAGNAPWVTALSVTTAVQFEEAVLLPGDEVSAVGVYSAARRRLEGQSQSALYIVKGGFPDARAANTKGHRTWMGLAVACYAVGAGVLIQALS